MEDHEEKKRKVKRLNKKLKEISQLAEKQRQGQALGKEQRLKLDRRQELEDDLVEAEEEEEAAEQVLGGAEQRRAEQERAVEGLARGLEELRLRHVAEVEALGCSEGEEGQDGEGAGQEQEEREGALQHGSVSAARGALSAQVSSSSSAVLKPLDSDRREAAAGRGRGKSPDTGVGAGKSRSVAKTSAKVDEDVWETVVQSKKGQKKKK